VGCWDALVSEEVWAVFFTGRATGESLQRELVRGVSGAWGVGGYGLGRFFSQGELQEKSCRESLSEALGELGVLVVTAWAVFFYRESCSEKNSRESLSDNNLLAFSLISPLSRPLSPMPLTPHTPLTSSLCKLSPVALPVKKSSQCL